MSTNIRHLFIVNPIAGGRDATDEVKSRAAAAFARREDEYEVYVTRGPMDACEKIALEAGKGGELRVYACGGDGTFNECVCGAAERENVSVCPFPTGTGNDFCRMFAVRPSFTGILRPYWRVRPYPSTLSTATAAGAPTSAPWALTPEWARMYINTATFPLSAVRQPMW